MRDQAHPTQKALCPRCGHPWGAHSSFAGAEDAIRHGTLGVPCIAAHPDPATPFAYCGCRLISPVGR